MGTPRRRVFRANGCTFAVKKASVRLFRGLLDRMFDKLIESIGGQQEERTDGQAVFADQLIE